MLKRMLALVSVILAGILPCAFASEKPVLLYFYDNYCSACNPEQEFADMFEQMTGRSVWDYAAQMYDVYSAAGQDALAKAAEAYSIGKEQLCAPLLIVDGAVYSGTRAIEEQLPYDFLENDGTESLVYYLYSPACESCAEASKVMDALGDRVEVTLGSYAFSSALRIERVDITQSPWLAQSLFDYYEIEEERRKTPMVLIGDTALAEARITQNAIELRLARGDALYTPVVEVAEKHDSGGFATAAAAGLTAGLNPCALSMLILLLSVLISTDKRAAFCAAAYLIGKLLTYLLIGTCFLALFQAWNPQWLPAVSKALMILICVTGAMIQFRDAYVLRTGKKTALRSQLPVGLRRKLHQHIRLKMSKAGRFAPVIAGVLGCTVAAGEFLCAGQLYLAVLLNRLHGDGGSARDAALLLAYCACFLAPSCVLCIAVLRGRKVMAVSEVLSDHEALIKAATGLVMLVLAVGALLL